MSKKLAKSSAAKVAPSGLARRPAGDAEWLADVKDRVRAAQQRAALAVNQELLPLYWPAPRPILAAGSGVLGRRSALLRRTGLPLHLGDGICLSRDRWPNESAKSLLPPVPGRSLCASMVGGAHVNASLRPSPPSVFELHSQTKSGTSTPRSSSCSTERKSISMRCWTITRGKSLRGPWRSASTDRARARCCWPLASIS